MIELLVRVLGRQRAWQLGRRIYMTARGEHANAIETNGEADLISDVVRAAGDTGHPLVVWDVGGNIGDYTQAVLSRSARAGRAATIAVFEPAPAAVERLRDRFKTAPQVTVFPLALSSEPGTMQFEMHGETTGTSTLQRTGAKNATVIDVTVDTAANVAEQIDVSRIDLMKIDAEGHDLEVIRGALPLLQANRIGVVQFEYNFRWLFGKHLLKEAFEIADATGYRLGMVQPGRIVFFEEWQVENERFFEANYVLVQPELANKLQHEMTRWSISNTPVVVGSRQGHR